jgi:multidrug resistance efflux pump
MLTSTPLVALDLEGSSAWGKRVVLSTSVSGVLSKLQVSVGQEVDQGSQLLALDTRENQARNQKTIRRTQPPVMRKVVPKEATLKLPKATLRLFTLKCQTLNIMDETIRLIMDMNKD